MNPTRLEILRQLLDALIPADDYPGAWEAGVGDFIQDLMQSEGPAFGAKIEAGLDGLQASGFLGLDAQASQAFLEGLEKGQDPFFELMLKLAAQGYYGRPGSPSWKMIGYRP